MTDDTKSVFFSLQELMAHFGVTRATIDRWRQKPDFPGPIGPGGGRGKLLFLKCEIFDFQATAPRRKLKPPPAD